MGGNLFGSDVRMSNSKYISMCNKIRIRMEDHGLFENLDYFFFKPLPEKITHGDIDILFVSKSFKTDIERIKCIFDTKSFVLNDDLISLSIDGRQIDVRFCQKDYVDSIRFYSDYACMGYIIGKLYNAIGFKLTDKGLFKKIKSENNKILLDSHHITSDPMFILELIGLSYERYSMGFESRKDIFKYIVSSSVFNKGVFNVSKWNSKSRRSFTKRYEISEFIEYINQSNPESIEINKSTGSDLLKTYDLQSFTKMESERNRLWSEDAEIRKAKEILNGKVIMDKYGITGSELGEAMSKFNGMFVSNLEKSRFVLNNPNSVFEYFDSFVLNKQYG